MKEAAAALTGRRSTEEADEGGDGVEEADEMSIRLEVNVKNKAFKILDPPCLISAAVIKGSFEEPVGLSLKLIVRNGDETTTSYRESTTTTAMAMIIENISKDSPFRKTSLKVGNELLTVNGQTCRDPRKACVTIAQTPPGEELTLTALRGSRKMKDKYTHETDATVSLDIDSEGGCPQGGIVGLRKKMRRSFKQDPQAPPTPPLFRRASDDMQNSMHSSVEDENITNKHMNGHSKSPHSVIHNSCATFHGARFDSIEATYEILPEIIGSGSFGTVRDCIHRRTRELFAVKSILKKSVKNQSLLENEIKLLRQANHANVVRTIDVIEDMSHIHIVMEKCTGGDLFEHVVEQGVRLDEGRVAGIIKSVLDAVSYLHAHNIVHRDLKVSEEYNSLCIDCYTVWTLAVLNG